MTAGTFAKMKDGRTHLGHKQEHAVDMDTGAVVAVTIEGANQGDTSTLDGTLEAVEQNLADARVEAGGESQMVDEPEEVVADKGYHSKSRLTSATPCTRIGGARMATVDSS